MREKFTYLAKRGLRNPEKIPPFLLGRLFPDSRWAPDWREQDGIITFREGGFAGGSPTRPELCARVYYEVSELRKALGDARYDRSLEVGCGYGRLSGWISDHAESNAAIEPNGDAVETASRQYPHIDFQAARADEMPFATGAFDLAVTWMVLTHVPPVAIDGAVEEIKRVTDPSGTILICERTRGERRQASWPRSREEYADRFDPFELVTLGSRGHEPSFDHGEKIDLMVFER